MHRDLWQEDDSSTPPNTGRSSSPPGPVIYESDFSRVRAKGTGFEYWARDKRDHEWHRASGQEKGLIWQEMAECELRRLRDSVALRFQGGSQVPVGGTGPVTDSIPTCQEVA